MTRRAFHAIGIAIALAIAIVGAVAGGQTPAMAAHELPPAARQVYDGVMSPFCPSLLLANCPSPQADSLRHAIATRAAAGASRDELVADLIATYGDVVRAAPAPRGAGLVAWLVPAFVVTAAVAALTRWLAGARQRAPLPPSVVPRPTSRDGTPEQLAALDVLLRRE